MLRAGAVQVRNYTSRMRYWLMKSEPDVYGINDLQRDGSTSWGGVRNYQVRNLFRDEFAPGDLALFYHSSCDEPGVAGVMAVAGPAYADPTQFDPRSEYHDPKSRRDNPAWLAVDVRFKKKLKRVIGLDRLRAEPKLSGLLILRRGNRLSVTPVTPAEWLVIEGLF
jgi:predicted RNA-binding protein with PUA-like domain